MKKIIAVVASTVLGIAACITGVVMYRKKNK